MRRKLVEIAMGKKIKLELNLDSLRVTSPDYDLHRANNLRAISGLANSTQGPLRLKYKDDIPYIGVRSWKTFFFELFTYADTDMRKIEKKTNEAIEKFVSPFLKDAEKNATATQDAKSGKISADCLLFKLRARAAGKSPDPKLGKTAWMQVSASEPRYNNVEVTHGKVRTFKGKIVVPPGLAIGLMNIENVVADFHLIGPREMVPDPAAGGISVDKLLDASRKPVCDGGSDYRHPDETDFCQFYLACLTKNDVFIHTCVAIEVVPDTRIGASSRNRNGAWKAASEFMERRKTEGKPVSILLCVQGNLPEVTEEPKLGSISDDFVKPEQVVIMSVTEDVCTSHPPAQKTAPSNPDATENDAGDSDEDTQFSASEEEANSDRLFYGTDSDSADTADSDSAADLPINYQSGDSDNEN